MPPAGGKKSVPPAAGALVDSAETGAAAAGFVMVWVRA